MIHVDLLDPLLFGNDAAEDEDEESLHYFFVDQNIFSMYDDPSREFSVCRARKGMGKSALIVYTATNKEQSINDIVVKTTGPEIQADFSKQKTPTEYIRNWTNILTELINNNYTSAIEGQNPTQHANPVIALSQASKKSAITGQDERRFWLFIDDIDVTFRNTDEERLYLSTFFTACRFLTVKYRWLRIRLSVRQDVWTTIRPSDEALDKCEQYMFDIHWSRNQTKQLLAKRIRRYMGLQAYTQRTGIKPGSVSEYVGDISAFEARSDIEILKHVFSANFPWGRTKAEPHHVIHVLSGGRPRWALQICKQAAAIAVSSKQRRIRFGSINTILPKYGQFRIADLVREHSHQCPEIEAIITGFYRSSVSYSTLDLIEFIERRILRFTDVFIDDGEYLATSLDVAHFLYRIGFIVGVDSERPAVHFRHEEKPFLMRSVTAEHRHIRWDIHSSYRAALDVS